VQLCAFDVLAMDGGDLRTLPFRCARQISPGGQNLRDRCLSSAGPRSELTKKLSVCSQVPTSAANASPSQGASCL
jgi:hypothetical protein